MNRRPVSREVLTFLGFVALTVIMTWPWALHLRDAVSDRGDPYSIAYWLWWDFHQTFHDPLNLFQATAFYPYKYTMAFTENNYGVSLLFFPMFALGFRPLTILSVATLVAFAFSGYGMFRLTRTLTNSVGAAWIAGIVFAFIPYHFQRIPHLHLIFTGWIPLMIESLVLFARERTWSRAIWVGITFTINALTCVTWFILTLLPLTLSGIFLLTRWHILRDRNLWVRGCLLMAAASLIVLGFLFQFYRVHELYGFVRSPEQVMLLSASPIHWLAISERNRLWSGLGAKAAVDELMLFPGFLPPLFAIAAFLLVKPASRQYPAFLTRLRACVYFKTLIILLDCLALFLFLITLLTIGYNGIHFKLFDFEVVRSSNSSHPFFYFVITVCIRLLLAPPQIVFRIIEKNYFARVRSDPRLNAYVLGLMWALIGVLGSFGMNLFFHRMLYEAMPLFRSMRAPSRWAMIAFVGLAILAGLGAMQIVELLRRWRPRMRPGLVYCLLAVPILYEQRVVPLQFVRGEVDPDAMTLRLKQTPMSGGIVELPAERDNYAYYSYMLRAADHGRPIVTASSSFTPPIVQDIEALTLTRPIPERFITLLEGIPASYLVVHKALLSLDSKSAIELLIKTGVATGRLRLVHREGDSQTGDELYAVTKTESGAQPYPNPIDEAQFFVRQNYLDLLGRESTQQELDSLVGAITKCGRDSTCLTEQRSQAGVEIFRSQEFKETRLFLYGLYHLILGRSPTYAEWQTGIQRLTETPGAKATLVKELQHQAMLAGQQKRTMTSAETLVKLASSSVSTGPEYNSAVVAICYFDYLKRDPDPQGYNDWLQKLAAPSKGLPAVINGFVSSVEYRSRFGQP